MLAPNCGIGNSAGDRQPNPPNTGSKSPGLELGSGGVEGLDRSDEGAATPDPSSQRRAEEADAEGLNRDRDRRPATSSGREARQRAKVMESRAEHEADSQDGLPHGHWVSQE